MSEMTAAERLDRTLAIVPWVANQPNGTAAFDEICDRFGIDGEDLRDCLVITSMVGVHPYTPDLLINAIIDADTVTIELPDYFRRPLRLTTEQTFALLTSAKALLSIPGADQGSALARGLEKVLRSLGEGSETAVEIGIATASDAITDDLRTAIASRRSVAMTYYSYGRDDTAARVVDPWHIHSEGGLWYLQAFCRTSSAERIFRIDRIRSVTTTADTFVSPDPLPAFVLFDSSDSLGIIKLHLRPSARWVVEYYPTESITYQVDGSVVVEIAIGSLPWLERLLLRLGPEAEILEASLGLEAVGQIAARRLLASYLG
ncbi:MAG: WYL domain-containing protein [Acidimicrobiales bacterium]